MFNIYILNHYKFVLRKQEKRIATLFFAILAINSFLSQSNYASIVEAKEDTQKQKYYESKAKATEDVKEKSSSVLSFKKDVYIIGPGDEINLVIFDAPEFSSSYMVFNDGSVQLPLIGTVDSNSVSTKLLSISIPYSALITIQVTLSLVQQLFLQRNIPIFFLLIFLHQKPVAQSV